MRSFAVLGPGGVGGLVAAALARAGEDVVVVARERTAELIAGDGIEVSSVRLGDFVARPAAAPRLQSPVTVLLVATKAYGLEGALERIESEPELVVPLLNGVEHMGTLRARFGAGRVAAGVIRVGSDRPAPGRIVQTSPFLRVDLAADDPGPRARLGPVAEALERAGIPVRIEASEAQVLWSKLVRLCALALTTAAADRPIGFIRDDAEWHHALVGCIAEAAAVANAEGAEIDPHGPLGEIEEANPGLTSSLQRDVAAGRESELDAIAGAVLRAAARHGLRCPTIARLSDQVAWRGLERRLDLGGGRPGSVDLLP
jgi:2-dehydropantoate 2-reductase